MISSILASLGFLLFVFTLLSPIALTIVGVVGAFRASTILGVASVFLHPLGLILGICFLFGKRNAAEDLATFFHLK